MTDVAPPDITRVSVIIADLNSPILDRVLDALYAQRLEPGLSVEIIVVGQDDPGCLRRFPRVIFERTEQPVGPAAARNMGIRRACGQLIAYLDADCVPDINWISEMVAAHRQHPQRAVIGGSIIIDADDIWALTDNLASFHAYLPTRRAAVYPVLPTCNLSIRRSAIEEVGLFDESFLINEDVDWTMRARRKGFSLYFHPSARVWHQTQRRTYRSVLRHAKHWGYYSIVNRYRYSDLEPLPFAFRHWLNLVVLSPLIAIAVTTGIFMRNPSALRHVYVFPLILGTKLAWCWGAARRLKQREKFDHVGTR